MTVRIGTANVKDTLMAGSALAALNKVSDASDLLGLQEWPARRNGMLRDKGSLSRGPMLGKHEPQGTWTWTRPLIGGGPVGARTNQAALLACHAKMLVGPGRVEGTAQAGVPRKGFLGPSWATVTRWEGFGAEPELVVINVHLTAEVQQGKVGYRKDMPKRVNRHRRERAALQRLVDRHLENGLRVAVVGDTNYHQMHIHGLTGWWMADDPDADQGTEGDRAIDVIETSWGAPDSVQILTSASDHNHPVATYKEPS